MRIINLTRHPVRFVLDNGTFFELDPGGVTARVGSRTVEDLRVELVKGVEIPIYRMVDQRLIDLPDPVHGVLYVTSGLVAAVATRPDVVAPIRTQRDSTGRVVGVKGLLHYQGKEV